jgi:hypothetical protein
MKEDTNEFIDGENYRDTKATFGYREIVMSKINHAAMLGAREMREGFMVYSSDTHRLDQPIKYVGDSRKEFTQAVEVVYDLLSPKLINDKETTTDVEAIFAEVDNLFLHRFSQYKEFLDNNIEIKENAQQFDATDFYWMQRIILTRKLFRRLCLFCETKLGWLEDGASEE